MKKITIATMACLAAVLFVPVLASAATTAELQAQIQALLAQIQVLQAQLNAQQGGTVAWCHTFSANFGVGSNGSEVAALQTALRQENNGENGSQSGVYDESTASLVTGFQEKYKNDVLTPAGLANGTGYVGARTRAKLNALYGCGNAVPPTPPITPPTPPPIPANNGYLYISPSSLSLGVGQSATVRAMYQPKFVCNTASGMVACPQVMPAPIEVYAQWSSSNENVAKIGVLNRGAICSGDAGNVCNGGGSVTTVYGVGSGSAQIKAIYAPSDATGQPLTATAYVTVGPTPPPASLDSLSVTPNSVGSGQLVTVSFSGTNLSTVTLYVSCPSGVNSPDGHGGNACGRAASSFASGVNSTQLQFNNTILNNQQVLVTVSAYDASNSLVGTKSAYITVMGTGSSAVGYPIVTFPPAGTVWKLGDVVTITWGWRTNMTNAAPVNVLLLKNPYLSYPNYILGVNLPVQTPGDKQTLTWTVGQDLNGQVVEAGSYSIQVCPDVRPDDSHCSTIGPITVAVSSVQNSPPVISSFTGPATLSVNQSGYWNVNASDPNGDQMTYYIAWGANTQPIGGGTALTSQTVYSDFHSYAAAGTYTVTATVTDSKGASTQMVKTVTVGSSTQTPTFSLAANANNQANRSYSAGSIGVSMLNFDVSNPSSEDIRIMSIQFSANGLGAPDHALSNVRVYQGGNLVGAGTIVAPNTLLASVNFPIPLVVPHGNKISLEVKADITPVTAYPGVVGTTVWLSVDAGWLKVIGSNTNAIAVGTGHANGGTITVTAANSGGGGGGGGYTSSTTPQAQPYFTQNGAQTISLSCGVPIVFNVPGYSQVWLVQTKNGAEVPIGIYNVPSSPYAPSCTADLGTYKNDVYTVENGLKGMFIGSVTATILGPSSPTSQAALGQQANILNSFESILQSMQAYLNGR